MWVVTLLGQLWRQTRVWWAGRNWRVLLGGLPALLLGAAVLGTALTSRLTPAREVEARYLDRAASAFKAGDYPQALTCYERLAGGGESPEVLYRLALAAEAHGDPGRAVSLMTELAPPDRRGYAPAHYWWARQLLGMPNPPPGAQAAARVHLVRALDGKLEDRSGADALLGQLYLSQGRLAEAERHLERAVRTRPLLRLSLARLHAQRKDQPQAHREAEAAISFFSGRAKTDLTNHEARLAWADGTAFLEDYPAAVAILEEGWQATRLPLYRSALARAYVAWYDFRTAQGEKDKAGQLALLEKGLRNDPAYRPLLDRLLAVVQTQGEAAGRVRRSLQGLLADGKGSATTHFVLGVDALRRGKAAEARVHWEQAHKLEPTLGVVANNLAWMVAQPPSADLPRALQLINLAVAQAPDQPQFRQTRGQIHARMKQWNLALTDLEAALKAMPDGPALHRELAAVYKQLGVPDMAAEHARRAEGLERKAARRNARLPRGGANAS
jgi:tetratricopeptide (TPR) repeat protein